MLMKFPYMKQPKEGIKINNPFEIKTGARPTIRKGGINHKNKPK